MLNPARTNNSPLAHKMSMALDFRLACLMAAIREYWLELEADEVEGALVVRVKTADKK